MSVQFRVLALVFLSSCFFSQVQAATDSKLVEEVAKKLMGTIFVLPHTESTDGKLKACGLEFSVLSRDYITREGAPVKLSGSYYLRQYGNDGFGYALKLGILDGFGSESEPVAPANAFVRAPRGKASVSKQIRTESSTPGFALYIGGIDASVVSLLEGIYEQKKLVLGFNRKPGEIDVLVTIDLRVSDTQIVGGDVKRSYSDDAVNEFGFCVGELLKSKGVK